MMSSRSSIVTLLICWSMIAGMKTKGVTRREADFATIFNGVWDNKDQVQKDPSFEILEIRLQPIDIPVLRPATVVYVEEAVNGFVNILNLAVVTEGPDGNIHVKRYNITHEAKLKGGSFNPDVLKNITLEELHGDDNCTAGYEQVEPRLFIGEWAVCNYGINGRHPRYSNSFTCIHFTVIIVMDVKEASTEFPYYFKRRGDRYPLIQVPDNYVSPCEDYD